MISLIVMLLLIGLLLWALNSMPFIDGNIKRIIYIIAVVFTVIYLLQHFGLMPAIK